MKAVLLVLVLGLGLSSEMNGQTIKGIGDDKIYHFAAGALFGGGVQAVVYSETGNVKKAFAWGLASSLTIGLAKEIVDEIQYGGFDSKDLLATFLGGVVITVPMNFSWKKHKRVNDWQGLRN